ncbi:TPA: amidohydrolase, partial [Staphylococcus argenteus]
MGANNRVIEWRRYFHQYPELSEQEFNTTQKIKDILTEHHITVL